MRPGTQITIASPEADALIGPELDAELEQRVFGPARAAGSELAVIAVTDPPPPVQYEKSPHGSWWLAADADIDPVALSNNGKTEAPPEVVDNLRSLRRAGVDFDLVYLLHEIPAEWEPGTPLPNMAIAPTGPSTSAPVVAFQEATFAAAAKMVGAVAAAASATKTAVGEMAAYDPLVLGGIKDPASNQIAWVAIAQWDVVAR